MSTLLPAAMVVLTPYIGISESSLDWNIAGSLGQASPNVLSELTYEDIRALQMGVKFDLLQPLSDGVAFTFEADYAYGDIRGGESQDSDYFGDDRTGEFSRTYADIGGNKAKHYYFGAGFSFPNIDKTLFFSVSAGKAKSQQFLNVTKGRQSILEGATQAEMAEISAFLYRHLNATYDAAWDGYYFALGSSLLSDIGKFQIRYELLRFDYNAEADWNLREDFMHPKSFAHMADGKGERIQIDYLYGLTKQLGLGLSLKYEKFKTDPGVDITYFSDGYVGATGLNAVHWKSLGVNLSVSYLF